VIAGVLPMQYFASAVTGSSTSLVANMSLVTKVYFPRVLLPLGSAITPAVDFLVGLPALLALMAYYHTWPSGPEVLTAPVWLALAFVTALGIGLALAAMNARYRDVPFMIPPFLQLMPFVSGVPFAVQEIPEKWQWILALNPMTAVVTGWRWAVLGAPAPVLGQAAIGVAVAFVLFVGGLTLFRSTEPRIADTI
jgi:lipopolysaccharide transport system permease protein